MSSSETTIRFVAETVPGTTPTDDPGWVEIPFTSATFQPQITRGQDRSVISDGMKRSMPVTDKSYPITINSELIAGYFDPFIAAVMGQDDWTTNQLVMGLAVPTFSIEKHSAYLDSGNDYVVYTGCAVRAVNFTCNFGENATIAIELTALSQTYAATSAVGIGTSAPVGDYDIITGASGFGPVAIGGSAAPADVIFTGYTIGIQRNLVEIRGMGGTLGPKDVAKRGMFTVPVTLNMHHTESTQGYAENVATETAFDLDVTLADPTPKSYQFDTPDVKNSSGADSDVTGQDSINMIDLSGEAQYDAGLSSVLQITRVP